MKPIWVDTISEITNGLCRICILAMACLCGVHCTENPIYVFPEMKLHSLVPNSYFHVSVSNLYILRIGLPIWLQQSKQTDPGNL